MAGPYSSFPDCHKKYSFFLHDTFALNYAQFSSVAPLCLTL